MIAALTFAIREAWRNLRQSGGVVPISIVTMTVVLTIFGAFLVFTWHLKVYTDTLRGRIDLEAYLVPGVEVEQVNRLTYAMERIPGILAVHIVTPDSARAIFRGEFGEDLIRELPGNPFPYSIRIQLTDASRNSRRAEEVARSVQSLPGVAEIALGLDWIRKMERLFQWLILITLSLGLVLGVGAAFIISSTIRLAIHSCRDTIGIMQLVGATPATIRRPFTISGLVQGAMGGLMAAVILALVDRFFLGTGIFTATVPLYVPALVIGAGLILGGVGSRWATGRYLKLG